MESTPALLDLEGLAELSHGNGTDMRQTLLRVLTDLYLQRATHTLEEERYYTELALRLIEATDVAARSALAARLATYPSAPRAIIEHLARDEIEVAAPILRHSLCLNRADLEAIAAERGGAHADLVASRLYGVAGRMQAPSRRDPPLAAEASDLSELFYAAGAPERRLILINLDYAPIAPARPASFLQRADIWRLEAAALRRNSDFIMRELERTLGISRAQARRIISDELGEPIVLAAKAMDLPTDVVPRMLLCMNPAIAQSVDRVYDLARLYGEISVDAARRLVALWRAVDDSENSRLSTEMTAWRTAAENAERVLSEITRRPALSQGKRLQAAH